MKAPTKTTNKYGIPVVAGRPQVRPKTIGTLAGPSSDRSVVELAAKVIEEHGDVLKALAKR